ncbi:MAG: ABC transporter substrate-binding protein [bacterium]|nr:ABC transporter substrate-binding protein [bacterium]
MDRRALILGLALMPVAAVAQNRRFRIGWLVFGGSALGPIDQSLMDALSERGYFEGHNLEILFRHANGSPSALAGLAAELAAQKPDVLIGIGGDVVNALFRASEGVIPVVGGVSDNPIKTGLAVNLPRPAKNFTGVAFLTDDLAAKRMELLKEVAPASKRVAAIWNPQHLEDEFVSSRQGAEKLGLVFTSHEINSADAIEGALRDVTSANADSLFVIPSRLTGIANRKITTYAIERRLPVVTAWREFVDNGCLLSYGPSRKLEARRLVDSVVKVLGGTKPADIPIELPVKFELVINLKTAKAIGLAIPPTLLARADDVVE